MPDSLPAQNERLSIQGLDFAYRRAYAEGHVCTAAEALALDSARKDHIRSNFAPKIIALCKQHNKAFAQELPAEALAALRTQYADYCKFYQIGIRASASVNETEILAERLAREAVLAKMRQQGIARKSRTPEWLDGQVTSVLKSNPWFMEEAARRIAAGREAAAQVVDFAV